MVKTLARQTGKIFTVRKLAGTAEVSASEAAKVVQELGKYGIITIQPVGRSYLVSLNARNYFVSKILRPIIKAEDETLTELLFILRKHLAHKGIGSAALFGSVARGQARDDSDIDLIVITDDLDAASGALSKAREEITLVFNGRLAPILKTRREIKARPMTRLLTSILEGYIQVSGKDLKEIAERN